MSPGESCDSLWGHRGHLFLFHCDKRSNVIEGALGKDRGCFILRHLILFRRGGLDLRFLAGPPFSIKVIASNKKLGDVDSPTVVTVRSRSETRKLTPRPHHRQWCDVSRTHSLAGITGTFLSLPPKSEAWWAACLLLLTGKLLDPSLEETKELSRLREVLFGLPEELPRPSASFFLLLLLF